MRAIGPAALAAAGAVRVEISGVPGSARHGLGPAVEPEAFRTLLVAAVALIPGTAFALCVPVNPPV